MSQHLILDATCGGKMMWFDKNHPNAVYCDKRREDAGIIEQQKAFSVEPDIECDFRDLPFGDGTFALVVFDPPHANISPDSIMGVKYGTTGGDWQSLVIPGIIECYRVLRQGGVLIFKWNEVSVKIGDVIALLPDHIKPLFGHTTAKSGKTKWVTFMKLDEATP